jgi:hypothetical protein
MGSVLRRPAADATDREPVRTPLGSAGVVPRLLRMAEQLGGCETATARAENDPFPDSKQALGKWVLSLGFYSFKTSQAFDGSFESYDFSSRAQGLQSFQVVEVCHG